MASIAIVTYFNVILDARLPLIIYAGCGLLWLMFFVAGCALSLRSRTYSLRYVIVLLVFGFILSSFEAYYLLSHYTLGFGIKLSSFLFSISAILFLMSAKIEHYALNHINMLFHLLEYIGSVSFILYLIHNYVIGWILPYTGILNKFWLSRWLLVVTFSLLLVQLLNRLIPKEQKYYIGLYD